MSQIAGKYEHVENVNFATLLKKAGYPEEKAAAIDKARGVITVTFDGSKIGMKAEVNGKVIENNLVLGQECDEISLFGTDAKTTVTKEGDVFKFVSKEAGGKVGTRLVKVTDSGLEMTLSFEGTEAKRIYKRL